MPTPTGLPKVGEVWQRVWKLPPDWTEQSFTFTVHQRGRGDYWSLQVRPFDGPDKGKTIWMVDASYYFSRGELRYVRN